MKPLTEAVKELEVQRLRDALDKTHGVRTEAAKLLGIPYRSVRYLIKKYHISVVMNGDAYIGTKVPHTTTEVLFCGCKVTKGFRCPFHNAP